MKKCYFNIRAVHTAKRIRYSTVFSISKIIILHLLLNFTVVPVIKVQNKLVGAALGTNVTLACTIEAFPYTINYWIKQTENHILQG